jgi:polyribonucleotide nucleotidyltransferase
VGRIDGKLIANPTWQQIDESDINIVMAASRDAIVMVEGSANNIPEDIMVDALFFGHDSVIPLLDLQEKLRAAVGREKREFTPPEKDASIEAKVAEIGESRIVEASFEPKKLPRYAKVREVRDAIIADMGDEYADRVDEIKDAVNAIRTKAVRSAILKEGRRIDGRDLTTVRPITCEVGVLPRVHGSALFTRGETQALVATTLGTERERQRIEGLDGDIIKRFMLHYNFPPFSVAEAKFLRGAGRREIGHGVLAERALIKVLPGAEEFPYVLRVVSETLESNGSSSMAAVCGGCLSLMDAGVPISAPVAGIAMGMVQEGDDVAILTDILGDEDHLGDMDFKVTGTREGITALQMDIKIKGLSRELLRKALAQAREGRLDILDEMDKTLAAPRDDLSKHAPRIVTVKVKPDRIRDIIGPGGKTIKAIVEQTGASIDVNDSGVVSIASADASAAEKAIEIIKGLTQEPEIGEYYLGTVRRITEFGAFVEILPGLDGLVHISEMAPERIDRVEDVCREGEEMVVKVLNVDNQGKIRLSRKEALDRSPEDVLSMVRNK